MGILLGLIILIFSAILHEVAHGYVADYLGDPTARLSGRLTLNPIKHIDLYMSIILPLLLIISGSPVIFGGAKPVPIDPFNLKEGRKDVALVSLAGPLTNVILAIVASIFIHLFTHNYFYADFLRKGITSFSTIIPFLFFTLLQMNLLLAIFNLIPIPPLDGSKIFALLLPPKEARVYLALGQVGVFILILLLVFPIGGFSLNQLIIVLFTFARTILGIS